MKYSDEIAGAVYPLMQNNLDRLLNHEKPIYIKFLTTNTVSPTSTRLHKGHYLFLYLSKINKSIEFYSKIKNTSFKSPSEVKKNDINKIQMDEKEFDEYIKGREEKVLLCLELERLIKLKETKENIRPISLSGRYIFTEELNYLIDK